MIEPKNSSLNRANSPDVRNFAEPTCSLTQAGQELCTENLSGWVETAHQTFREVPGGGFGVSDQRRLLFGSQPQCPSLKLWYRCASRYLREGVRASDYGRSSSAVREISGAEREPTIPPV
jgi:hypothetical protein